MTRDDLLDLATRRLPAPSTHLPWTGDVLRGRPVTVVQGRTIDLATTIWVYVARRPVPSTYTVRSTCGTPRCVRANHLRADAPPRTGYQPLNWLGEAVEFAPDLRPPGTTCTRGHDLLDLGNVHWYRDKPRCRACQREDAAAASARAGKPRQHLKDNGGRYTRCRRGHLLAGENVVVEPGSGFRRCKTCYRLKEQRKRDKRQQARTQAEPAPAPESVAS